VFQDKKEETFHAYQSLKRRPRNQHMPRAKIFILNLRRLNILVGECNHMKQLSYGRRFLARVKCTYQECWMRRIVKTADELSAIEQPFHHGLMR